MSSLIQMPRQSAGLVTQLDLAEYRVLQKELRDARLALKRQREYVAAKLREGAAVEEGMREATLLQVDAGGRTVERLIVRF